MINFKTCNTTGLLIIAAIAAALFYGGYESHKDIESGAPLFMTQYKISNMNFVSAEGYRFHRRIYKGY